MVTTAAELNRAIAIRKGWRLRPEHERCAPDIQSNYHICWNAPNGLLDRYLPNFLSPAWTAALLVELYQRQLIRIFSESKGVCIQLLRDKTGLIFSEVWPDLGTAVGRAWLAAKGEGA